MTCTGRRVALSSIQALVYQSLAFFPPPSFPPFPHSLFIFQTHRERLGRTNYSTLGGVRREGKEAHPHISGIPWKTSPQQVLTPLGNCDPSRALFSTHRITGPPLKRNQIQMYDEDDVNSGCLSWLVLSSLLCILMTGLILGLLIIVNKP